MESPALVARKVLFALSLTLALVGAWLWFAPFFGPPGTQQSNKTIVAMRYGERGLCRPALFGVVGASLSDDTRVIGCQVVGAGRWESGWLFFATAGVLAGVSARMFPSPASDGEEPSTIETLGWLREPGADAGAEGSQRNDSGDE